MSKTKELKHPDYEKMVDIATIDTEIWNHKDALSKKVRSQRNLILRKKETAAEFNEEIKEVAEELEHEIKVLEALEERRKILFVGQQQGKVLPISGNS